MSFKLREYLNLFQKKDEVFDLPNRYFTDPIGKEKYLVEGINPNLYKHLRLEPGWVVLTFNDEKHDSFEIDKARIRDVFYKNGLPVWPKEHNDELSLLVYEPHRNVINPKYLIMKEEPAAIIESNLQINTEKIPDRILEVMQKYFDSMKKEDEVLEII